MPKEYVKLFLADDIVTYITKESDIKLVKASNYVGKNLYYLKKEDVSYLKLLIKKYQSDIKQTVAALYRKKNKNSRLLMIN